ISPDGKIVKEKDLGPWLRRVLPGDALTIRDAIGSKRGVYLLAESAISLQVVMLALDWNLNRRWYQELGPHGMVMEHSLTRAYDGAVVVTLTDGEVLWMNEDGHIRWWQEFPAPWYRNPMAWCNRSGAVYVSFPFGVVNAMDSLGRVFWSYA